MAEPRARLEAVEVLIELILAAVDADAPVEQLHLSLRTVGLLGQRR
jgi:hypothetical protein